MHRFTTNYGIRLIKQFEGFRNRPYVCSGGYKTIGYGHKLSVNEHYESMSQEKAEQILVVDLFVAEQSVIKYINAKLANHQFDALVSFTFNCGSAALQRSTLRQKINYELYDDAKEEFMRWIYAGGKKIYGLMLRRQVEGMLFAGQMKRINHTLCGA